MLFPGTYSGCPLLVGVKIFVQFKVSLGVLGTEIHALRCGGPTSLAFCSSRNELNSIGTSSPVFNNRISSSLSIFECRNVWDPLSEGVLWRSGFGSPSRRFRGPWTLCTHLDITRASVDSLALVWVDRFPSYWRFPFVVFLAFSCASMLWHHHCLSGQIAISFCSFFQKGFWWF